MNVEQAIILAAGRGSRLGADRPKCLTQIAGRPIIQWQVDALRRNGIQHITIVAGYQAEQISGWADQVVVNRDWATTNMVASLMVAREVLAGAPSIVAYGDIIYGAADVALLRHAPDDEIAVAYDPNWLGLWQARFSDVLSDAESFAIAEDRAIIDVGRRVATTDDIQGQYCGLLRLTPEGMAWMTDLWSSLSAVDRSRIDMTTLLRRLIERGRRLAGVAIEGPWCEVDSPGDVAVAERIMAGPGRGQVAT